jgi:hypothetical protein
MDDKALFGKLLDVLNRIDARLQAIETSVATAKPEPSAAGTNSGPLIQDVRTIPYSARDDVLTRYFLG